MKLKHAFERQTLVLSLLPPWSSKPVSGLELQNLRYEKGLKLSPPLVSRCGSQMICHGSCGHSQGLFPYHPLQLYGGSGLSKMRTQSLTNDGIFLHFKLQSDLISFTLSSHLFIFFSVVGLFDFCFLCGSFFFYNFLLFIFLVLCSKH